MYLKHSAHSILHLIHILQVKASVKVTTPKGRFVEQPSRAEFVERNNSSSFKVNKQLLSALHTLHTVRSIILYLLIHFSGVVCLPCTAEYKVPEIDLSQHIG